MGLDAAEGSPRTVSLMRADSLSGGGSFRAGSAAVGGDGGVPCLAGGDHRVQVAQDRGGENGLSLRRGEPVLFTEAIPAEPSTLAGSPVAVNFGPGSKGPGVAEFWLQG